MPNDTPNPGGNLEETAPGATVPGVETTNDHARVSYPGVYIDETGAGGKTIPGVATSGSGGGRLGFLSAAAALFLRHWRRPPSP